MPGRRVEGGREGRKGEEEERGRKGRRGTFVSSSWTLSDFSDNVEMHSMDPVQLIISLVSSYEK